MTANSQWQALHPDYALWRRDAFLAVSEADNLFARLEHDLPWQRPVLTLYGKRHPIPRSQVWMGDPDMHYRYSATTFDPVPWHPCLSSLRHRIQHALDIFLGYSPSFNSVLINRYADGDQRMGWHSDDEIELGEDPVIASLSLGLERPLRFRPRKGMVGQAFNIWLPHGSLLLMGAGVQRRLQHALLPRRMDGCRINLTFREIQR